MKFKKTVMVSALSMALLSACNSGSNNPTNGGDNPAPAPVSKGRIVFAESNQNQVHILDLDSGEFFNPVQTTHPVVRLGTSPNYRFAGLNQSKNGRFEFLDGGLWREPHGDHHHDHADEPVLTGYAIDGAKPAHFDVSDDKVVLFFDGDKETQVNAKLYILSDESIAAKTYEVHHEFPSHQHGTGLVRGDELISTLRSANAADTTTMADTVALFDIHGDHLHELAKYAEPCVDLHGSYHNKDFAAFACADGILKLTPKAGGGYTTKKLAYPTDKRVWTLKGAADSNAIIGLARDQQLKIDLANDTVEAFDWRPNAQAAYVTYTQDYQGARFFVLDSQGYVNVFDSKQNWAPSQRFQVTDAYAEGDKWGLVTSKSDDHVYFVEYSAKKVEGFNASNGRKVSEVALDFQPTSAVWVGITAK
ncbi:hypothetical protein [Thaumasiovibrio subtropicus]|uniref:hypothetical protein n=1 Tax=Thaumasiovibrio subtropicus TaxID=1891207 RepID=UPI00131D0143|nr:hypothetical protein [Thaumasiovibrio subtropicus]